MGKGFAGAARRLLSFPAPLFFTLAKKIQIIEIYQLKNSNIWIFFQKTGSTPHGESKKMALTRHRHDKIREIT